MSDDYRITIRNVDPDLADMFRVIAFESGTALGDTFDSAVLALKNERQAALREFRDWLCN